MHHITFTEQHLRKISPLLTNTYAKYHLCWPIFRHNITFIDQHLWTISPLL